MRVGYCQKSSLVKPNVQREHRVERASSLSSFDSVSLDHVLPLNNSSENHVKREKTLRSKSCQIEGVIDKEGLNLKLKF